MQTGKASEADPPQCPFQAATRKRMTEDLRTEDGARKEGRVRWVG